MIKVDNVLISDDVRDKHFVCHLEKCKGACCVEGELGAPLEEEELPILKEIYPHIKSYLSPKGIKAIEKEGYYILDEDGDYSTTTIGGKECAYSIYDKQGLLKCGIEQAFKDDKIKFQKPVSCHLYPIRVSSADDVTILNYHQWDICKAACTFGKKLGIPIYQFLKEPLIRKFGKAWYKKLETLVNSEK